MRAVLLTMRVCQRARVQDLILKEPRSGVSKDEGPEASYAFFDFSRSRMLPKMPLGRKMMNSTKSTP